MHTIIRRGATSKNRLTRSIFQHVSFGGGGAKGAAHLGVLDALAKSNRMDYIQTWMGTSIGALMAYNKAIGVPTEFLKKFMGFPTDKTAHALVKKIKATNLETIVSRSKDPFYIPSGMLDLTTTAFIYGSLGNDPLHLDEALQFDHPIVLEEMRLLDSYKDFVKTNKNDLSKLMIKRDLDELLGVLATVENMTFGQWSDFIEGLDPDIRKVTGLGHFSCAVTKMDTETLSPMTLTSIPSTIFSKQSRDIPMILGVAASAAFPFSLPPVKIDGVGSFVDGGIFQNLLRTKQLTGEDSQLLINLGHKKVQDAWDYGSFYNFGEMNRIALSTIFKRRLVIGEEYFDCTHGYLVDDDICIIGVNELAISDGVAPIKTLSKAPTAKQILALYESAQALTLRGVENGQLETGQIIVDFAGVPYGNVMSKIFE